MTVEVDVPPSTASSPAPPSQPSPVGAPAAPAKPRRRPIPVLDATPTHWPLVAPRPGRALPVLAPVYVPKGTPNTVDGKVWTQTLYTVAQPLGLEWGYGQVGTQLDVENILGTPLGAHVDGFFQQRLYHRPLRVGLRAGFVYFDDDPLPAQGIRHARYLTYDRLTEANVQFRNRWVDVKVGRTIVPQMAQAFVDGAYVSVAPVPWVRVGGFAGLMPNVMHPRMWLDRDYRSLSGFFPASRSDPVTAEPLQSTPSSPASGVDGWLQGQTIFQLQALTAGGHVSFRLDRFTSDTGAQIILWNPALGYRGAATLTAPTAQQVGLDSPLNTVTELVDAAYLNHVMTFRPLPPLSFRIQGSWDAWGAMRAFNMGQANQVRSPAAFAKLFSPALDSTLGLREALADATFRGEWPVGLNLQFHHFQSVVTAASYGYFQRDLLQPGAAGAFAAAQSNTASPPTQTQLFLLSAKSINNQYLGTVQRERLRLSGWVRPFAALSPQASAQLYAEGALEWRRDFPLTWPSTNLACTQDRTTTNPQTGEVTPGPDQHPEGYDSRAVCGSTHYPRQDDHLRASGTVGLRDPTLYDNVTYDFSVTATDGWNNRTLVARGRVAAQAFEHFFWDAGLAWELAHNQRYFTSTIPYDTSGGRRSGLPLYPANAVGQSFVLDTAVMYRVALGLTFDASYVLFFEEEPVVQDYVLDCRRTTNCSPAGIQGYVPADPFQSQQMLMLRAVYRL